MENQKEALNLQQRRKRGMQLRRRKARIKRQKQLVMRRFADKSRIAKRAKRGARTMFKKRFSGGKSYSKLSPAQKITVDKRAEKFKKAIARISARLVPQVRRKELSRKRTANEELDLDFLDLFIENYDEPETDGLDMAEAQLFDIAEDATAVIELLSTMEEEPDEWVLSKITLAADYLSTVRDFLEYYEEEEDEEDDEEEYSESVVIESLLNINKKDLDEEEREVLSGFFEEYGSLKKKSETSNIPFEIVLEVYHRGLDEYEESDRTAQQCAFDRVNSFISGGDTDADLQEKVLEYGTDDSRIYYARATPGQNPDIVTMKYSVDSVMNALNDVNTQRIKKIHERVDDEFAEVFGEKK